MVAKRKEKLAKASEWEFLRDAPAQIQAILARFHDGAEHERVSKEMEDYAGGFLAGWHPRGWGAFPHLGKRGLAIGDGVNSTSQKSRSANRLAESGTGVAQDGSLRNIRAGELEE